MNKGTFGYKMPFGMRFIPPEKNNYKRHFNILFPGTKKRPANMSRVYPGFTYWIYCVNRIVPNSVSRFRLTSTPVIVVSR